MNPVLQAYYAPLVKTSKPLPRLQQELVRLRELHCVRKLSAARQEKALSATDYAELLRSLGGEQAALAKLAAVQPWMDAWDHGERAARALVEEGFKRILVQEGRPSKL